MNDEGVVALLGLVLMTFENQEIRIPQSLVAEGLPANSAVRVFNDEKTDEIVIQIAGVDDE